MSTALRLQNVLNVTSSEPPPIFLRVPCIHARAPPLARKPVEKCGLEEKESSKSFLVRK